MDSDPQRQTEGECGTRILMACSHFSCSSGVAHMFMFLWLEAAETEENLPEVTALMFCPSLTSLDYRIPALFKRYVGTRRAPGRVAHEAERLAGLCGLRTHQSVQGSNYHAEAARLAQRPRGQLVPSIYN